MNLKVCILPFRISASGAASYTIELANALARSGLNVTVIGCEVGKRSDEIDPSVELIDIGKDPVRFMYAGGPITDHIILSKKLKEVVKRHIKDFDILHFTLASASLFFNHSFVTTAWLPLNTPELIKLHPMCYRLPKSLLASVALIQYNFMEEISFRKASRIIGLTRATYERMLVRYRRKAVLIPPPIKIRDEHKGGRSDRPVLLFVARDLDYPRKNLKTALRAMSILADKGIRSFRFVIIGKGVKVLPDIERLRRKGLEIICLGRLRRNRVLEIMGKSDLFLSPNIYEELNYTTLEALGSGLPIIASDIPPFRDFVINGENGYLIPATDYEALAKKLEELIINHDQRKRMSMASLKLAKLNFSYEVVGQRLIRLYQEILDER